MPLSFAEEVQALKTFHYVIGVDEAGRGPLAGPVVAAAFCYYNACHDVRSHHPAALSFLQSWPWRIVGDSKTLSEGVRETLYEGFLQAARNVAVQESDVSTMADASTADTSLETLASAQQEEEAEIAVSSDDNTQGSRGLSASLTMSSSASSVEPTQDVEVRISTVKEMSWVAGISSPLFDTRSPIYFEYAISEPGEIDRTNILEASLRSMTRAVYKVICQVCQRAKRDGHMGNFSFKILVDGNRNPHLLEPGMIRTSTVPSILNGPEGVFINAEQWREIVLPSVKTCANEPVVKGDSKILSIAAASVVAKVVRDRIMRDLALSFPAYGLEIHKGYPTAAHDAVIRAIGPSVIHRLSFSPIYPMLLENLSLVPEGRDFEEVKAARLRQKNSKRPSAKQPTASRKKSRAQGASRARKPNSGKAGGEI